MAIRSAVSLLTDLEDFSHEIGLTDATPLGEIKERLEERIVEEQKERLIKGRDRNAKSRKKKVDGKEEG